MNSNQQFKRGVAGTAFNNTVYLYGEKRVWSISAKDISNSKSPTQLHYHQNNTIVPDDLTYHASPSLALDHASLLVFSNKTVYSFDLSLHRWSSISTLNSTVAVSDFSVSLAPNQDKVYLLGGKEAWVYYVGLKTWRPFVSRMERCGHTSTMLPDGNLVILGGYTCSEPSSLIPMAQINVYNSYTSTWTSPEIKGNTLPSARTYHSAIVMNKNNLFICGGQDGQVQPFQVYMGSEELEEMTAVLDTATWTWRIPKLSYLNQPYPQSYATLALVNTTKLVFGFGINYHTVQDRFHVFDTVTETWQETSFSRSKNSVWIENSSQVASSMNQMILWIILGCIGGALILSYSIAVWNFGYRKLNQKFFKSMKLIKREIWKPRVGEPGWAETARLILKLMFLLLFMYLILTLSNQVIHSPIIDQLSFETGLDRTIDVPDIKFCFDGFVPYIRCTTDFGIQCTDYIQPSSVSTTCLVFQAPDHFKLGQTTSRLQSNGSFLKFDYYTKEKQSQLDTQQIQIELFHKLYHHNSNAASSSPSSYYYSVPFGQTDTIHYQLMKRVRLVPGLWNYIGVSPLTEPDYELETISTTDYFSTRHDPSSGSPEPLGSLQIVPISIETRVYREQKAFAWINAMGICGGLFGLLFSLQSCLFGYRPRSPWGYLHRWSFGNLRSSLMLGLQNRFVVPSTTAEKERLGKMEDRLHVLESLFQAYYIDDEIFRELEKIK